LIFSIDATLKPKFKTLRNNVVKKFINPGLKAGAIQRPRQFKGWGNSNIQNIKSPVLFRTGPPLSLAN